MLIPDFLTSLLSYFSIFTQGGPIPYTTTTAATTTIDALRNQRDINKAGPNNVAIGKHYDNVVSEFNKLYVDRWVEAKKARGHDKFYFLVPKLVDFHDAGRECNAFSEPGYGLATIKTPGEFLKAKNLIFSVFENNNDTHGEEAVLFGAQRSRILGGDFYWLANNKLAVLSNGTHWKDRNGNEFWFPPFAQGEPNDHFGNEDCVHLAGIKNKTAMAVADTPCSMKHFGVLCQYQFTEKHVK